MTTMEAADEQEHDADDAHAGRQLQDADLTDVQPTRQQRSLMERQQRVQRLVGSYKVETKKLFKLILKKQSAWRNELDSRNPLTGLPHHGVARTQAVTVSRKHIADDQCTISADAIFLDRVLAA
eukprot:jgi/Chrzof1/1478/Cz10g09110.t1